MLLTAGNSFTLGLVITARFGEKSRIRFRFPIGVMKIIPRKRPQINLHDRNVWEKTLFRNLHITQTIDFRFLNEVGKTKNNYMKKL